MMTLEAGKSYLWCSRGRSKNQPFYDGVSHKDTGFKPVRYKEKVEEDVIFCECHLPW